LNALEIYILRDRENDDGTLPSLVVFITHGNTYVTFPALQCVYIME
jgi:hypothetical protein